MSKYIQKLLPGSVIHAYGRTNGKDKLFYSEANYEYFLNRYKHKVSPMAETLCYFLHINHFHFVIRIKETVEIDFNHDSFTRIQKIQIANSSVGDLPETLAIVASKHFSNFLNGYVQAINKQEYRHGNLIQRPFKRKLLGDDDYIRTCIMYIHANPVRSRLAGKLEDSFNSSYPLLVSDVPTWLDREATLGYFGGLDNMIALHRSYLGV